MGRECSQEGEKISHLARSIHLGLASFRFRPAFFNCSNTIGRASSLAASEDLLVAAPLDEDFSSELSLEEEEEEEVSFPIFINIF